MAAALQCWTLWDFGGFQGLRHSLVGQWLPVHGGQRPLFSDGPFKLIVHENRAALVGVYGGDDDCSIHWVDEICDFMVNETVDETGDIDYHVTGAFLGDKPEALLSSLQDNYNVLSLEIVVGEGLLPFQTEFHRYRVPMLLEDGSHVALWSSLRRVLAYVWGASALEKVWYRARCLQAQLKKEGLTPEHVRESSRAMKRKQDDVSLDKADETTRQSSDDWLVSTQALIAFLDMCLAPEVTCFGLAVNDECQFKAKRLLSCILGWPLGQEVSFGFISEVGRCEMLLSTGCIVSYDALAESEEHYHCTTTQRKHRNVALQLLGNLGYSKTIFSCYPSFQ